MLDRLLSSDLIWRLGWMLLHSLWQLLLLGAATTLILALLSRQSAKLRYWIACCGLASCYAPLVAFFFLFPPHPDPETALSQRVNVTTPGGVPASEAPSNLGAAFEHSERPAEKPPALRGSAPAIASEPQALVKTPIAPQLTGARSRKPAFVWQLWVVGGWVTIVGFAFDPQPWRLVRCAAIEEERIRFQPERCHKTTPGIGGANASQSASSIVGVPPHRNAHDDRLAAARRAVARESRHGSLAR